MSNNLDFLRAVAVLCVAVFHLLLFNGIEIRALGLCGVLIFFVHTTLVLMFSLERLPEQNRYATFIVRRIFRIYPLSIAVVLFVWFAHIPQTHLAPHYFGFAQLDLKGIFANLALVQNLTGNDSSPGVLWSLPFEMQMYLVLPLLFWASRYRFAIIAAWVLALPVANHYGLWLYVPCFIPGVLAYQRWGKRVLPAWMWPFALFALITAFVTFGKNYYAGWLMCLALGAVLPYFKELPDLKLPKQIAKYSYGIYLTHMLAMWFAFSARNSWPLFVALFIAFPIALYHLIEHPMIRVGIKLSTPAKPKVLAAAAQ